MVWYGKVIKEKYANQLFQEFLVLFNEASFGDR
jgi:hypothetical protein